MNSRVARLEQSSTELQAKILRLEQQLEAMRAGGTRRENIAAANIHDYHLVDGLIHLAHMADESVDSDQYVDGSIDKVHLSADSVDGTKIGDDSIDSEHYVADSIDEEHYAPGSVNQTALKTTLTEVQAAYPGGNVAVEAGNYRTYCYWPQVKVVGTTPQFNISVGTALANQTYITNVYFVITVGGDATAYAQFVRVTASRDEPVVWLCMEGNKVRFAKFDAECNGDTHPFPDYDPEKHTIKIIELKDDNHLRKHLFKHIDRGVLEQIHIGLATGAIRLTGRKNKPRLNKQDAPCLYDKQVEVVGFTFDKEMV